MGRNTRKPDEEFISLFQRKYGDIVSNRYDLGILPSSLGIEATEPAGMCMVLHSQGGDLHTPRIGLNSPTAFCFPDPITHSSRNHNNDLVHIDPLLTFQTPRLNQYGHQAPYEPTGYDPRESDCAMGGFLENPFGNKIGKLVGSAFSLDTCVGSAEHVDSSYRDCEK